MARNDPEVRLRLPEDLKNHVAEAARTAGRSMNAEIVARLDWSYRSEADPDTLKKVTSRLGDLLERLDRSGLTELIMSLDGSKSPLRKPDQ